MPPGRTVGGVNTAVTPQGRPVTANVTLPENPPTAATLTVVDADRANPTVRAGEASESVNPGGMFKVTLSPMVAVAVALPLDPVSVKLPENTGAEEAAVSFSVEVPPTAADAGVNVAVTPAGSPETASATLPVKPPLPATLMLVVADEPAITAMDEGVAVSVIPGAGVTLRPAGAVPVRLPLDPVSVKLPENTGAEEAAVTFNVDVPPAAADAGVNVAVTPAGSPETASATLPAKPPIPAILMVAVAEAPAASVRAEGAAVSAKPGAGVTLRVIAAVPVTLPLEPINVRFTEDATAEAAAASVSVEFPPTAADAGANVAVTPAGKPETASATLPVNPLEPATPTAVATEDPATTVKDGEAALNKTAGAAVTLNAILAVPVRLPLKPVSVMLAEDTAAEAAAVSVSVEVSPPVGNTGEKVAVTPAGSPETANATVPVKPPAPTTLMPAVTEDPPASVKAGEAGDRVKPGVAVTASVNGVAPVTDPLEPVSAMLPDDGAAEAAAVSFSVAVPPAATAAGEKAAVTPAGRPETVRLTLPVKASFAATFTDAVAEPPTASATDAGLALTVKPVAVTLRPIGSVPVSPSPVPVRVKLEEPTLAQAAAVSVSVELPPAATAVGANAAVTPMGRPDTASVTLPAKLPIAETVTVVFADAPLAIPIDMGVALRVKPGGVVTFRLSGTAACRLPLEPVRVRLEEARLAEAAAVTISAAVPPAATDAGANAAVTPAGRPETASVTLPVKPLIAATCTVVFADVPATTATDDGAPKVKPGTAVTVKPNGNVPIRLPLTPVKVTAPENEGAEAAAVSVSVPVPPGAIAVGVNAAVTPAGKPAGKPEGMSVTLPWNPPKLATPMPTVTDDPAAIVREEGAALSVKPGAAAA